MKRLILIITCFALTLIVPAQSMFKFGVRGGLNLTQMNFSENPFSKDNQAGFFVGPTLLINIPASGIGFDISAIYDQRGGDVYDKSLTQKSIAIPVNIRFGLNLFGPLGIFVKGGPQFAFNVGDKEFDWLDGSQYQVAESNLTLNVGGGFLIMKRFEIFGNYSISCGRTGDGTWRNILTGEEETFRQDNKGWQLGATWYF
ncbi:MAG: outer membrane beta-barrel protein [Prevotellaceae bacterium]|nr:outer membrane beta-barrel protein [Prevotellaceae bacterium]